MFAAAVWLPVLLPMASFVAGCIACGGSFGRQRRRWVVGYYVAMGILLFPTLLLAQFEHWAIVFPGLALLVVWFTGPVAAIAIVMGYRPRWRKPVVSLCPHCGYNLWGNTSGICSECGHPIPARQLALLKTIARHRTAPPQV